MTDPTSSSGRAVLTGSAALAFTAGFPGGIHAQGAGPEVKGVNLGYIALTDAAPLIVAKERGLFAKHGMPDVEVQKQASWGGTRDNLVLGGGAGGIDGAHLLTPMAYLIHTGRVVQNSTPVPMALAAIQPVRIMPSAQTTSPWIPSRAVTSSRLDASTRLRSRPAMYPPSM